MGSRIQSSRSAARVFVSALVSAACGLLACGAASAQTPPACAPDQLHLAAGCSSLSDAAEGIRNIVRAAIKKNDLQSVIVSVRVGDDEVLTEAWGRSMTDVPATVDMRFRNGAIAIPYLTIALLQLSDEGVVSLDDAVSKWFPDYPKADRVTLRMLANSTSGYEDYVPFLPFDDDVFRQWTPKELIEMAFAHPMSCEPGACFHYAHTNFVILGEILHKATGKPVKTLMAERIIKPLGLTGTQSDDNAVMPEPVLHAFTSERGVYEDSTYWNPSWTLAHGAIMSTNIHDALASAVAFGTGSLVSAKSQEAFLAPLTAKFAPMNAQMYYGLGIVVTNAWLMQTPSFAGYAAVIGYLPQKRIAFAVTVTQGPKTPDTKVWNELAGEIASYLAPDHKPRLP